MAIPNISELINLTKDLCNCEPRGYQVREYGTLIWINIIIGFLLYLNVPSRIKSRIPEPKDRVLRFFYGAIDNDTLLDILLIVNLFYFVWPWLTGL